MPAPSGLEAGALCRNPERLAKDLLPCTPIELQSPRRARRNCNEGNSNIYTAASLVVCQFVRCGTGALSEVRFVAVLPTPCSPSSDRGKCNAALYSQRTGRHNRC